MLLCSTDVLTLRLATIDTLHYNGINDHEDIYDAAVLELWAIDMLGTIFEHSVPLLATPGIVFASSTVITFFPAINMSNSEQPKHAKARWSFHEVGARRVYSTTLSPQTLQTPPPKMTRSRLCTLQ